MAHKTVVCGVGMVPFCSPSLGRSYTEIAPMAIKLALEDAGLDYDKVQQAYAGYMYADTCAGQRVFYDVGMTSIPIINVNNACATGSTGIFLARQAIENGAIECAAVVGFEQMVRGALGLLYDDRPSPLEKFAEVMITTQGDQGVPGVAHFFGGAGQEYMDKYGIEASTFGKISVKARQHAAKNPLAVFKDEVTLDEVMSSPKIFGPLTRLQCCPPTTGAAAAILCSESFAKRHGLDASISIAAQSMRTDFTGSFENHSMMTLVGYDMAQAAANDVYEASAIGPADLDVIELHDCFTANELLSYEALGLTAPGTAEKFIEDGDNTYGGKYVTNPSGGLLSKGHPIGATGLAQCYELVTQLRGRADARQVENANIALQHNLGLGGACVVTMYQKN